MRWIEKRKKKLFEKFLHRTISPSELRELESLSALKDDNALLLFLDHINNSDTPAAQHGDAAGKQIAVASIIRSVERKKLAQRRLLQVLSASCLILVIGIAVFYYRYSYSGQDKFVEIVGGSCPPPFYNSELSPQFFACNMEVEGVFKTKLDNKDFGKTIRINNMEFTLDRRGILKMKKRGNVQFSDGKDKFLVLRIPPQRQFIVQLPDGAIVRLDGGSFFQYLLNGKSNTEEYCRLLGQAYVQVPAIEDRKVFVLENANSQLLTRGGAYVVVSDRGYTRATLLSGSVSSATKIHERAVDMDENCNVLETYTFSGGNKKDYDSTVTDHIDKKTALNWTKSVREYEKVPLRNFMLDMQRWYGLKIESLRCLPKNITITTSICQKEDVGQVFASLGGNGVSIYNRQGMYTFCPPVEKMNKRWDNIAYGLPTIKMKKLGLLWFWKKW